jgi:acetoin utilization deacetylase AcuC-like enzyme
MKAFYAGQYVLPLPADHRFPMAKYGLLRDRIDAELPQVELHEALPASLGELALAHTPAYVQSVLHGSLSAQMQRDIGFPWSPAMAERARRSVGGTIAAARASLGLYGVPAGVAANMAGGTHHASADQGGGFCVFNDVAVAARLMQAEWSRQHRVALRVAVVDLDVHQGNGTARIFSGDDSVFTLSMHGEKNFPFRKERSDLDVGLPDGCGDADYLRALEQALAALAQRFEPQLLFYLAGADCHEGDRLGRLRLSFDGLLARDRCVLDWAWQRRIPTALAMAGGYGRRLEDTVQVQINTFGLASSYAQRWQNRAS